MKKPRLIPGIVVSLLSVCALGAGPERVRVTTNHGAFIVELQRDRAPLTVENFLYYVRAGHYTNTLFHRVIPDFVVQGGGVGLDYKAKPTQKPIPNEAGNGLKNMRGAVGLARAAGPHTGDAQFYINVADNDSALDPLPTRWGYAVFGRVIEGMEVVDRISVSPTGAMGPFKEDSPLRAVVIQKIELIGDATATTTPVEASPAAVEPDSAAETQMPDGSPAEAPPTEPADDPAAAASKPE